MDTPYTLETARAQLPEARSRIGELATTMARLQQLAARSREPNPPTGTVADAKAAEAAADEQLSWFREHEIQVKGIAPALLDFPARAVRDGSDIDVLLCWREGEADITHFHPPETGYLGREPLAMLDEV